MEENVWLGLNTIVMPGVRIEKNSFSVANSVIINSFEENSYLKGNPAIKIKNRFVNEKHIG
jgi:virginiamycin A acetyltransferase